MNLSISIETVEILYNTAIELRKECEEINAEQLRLQTLFLRNRKYLGPHSEQIDNIIQKLCDLDAKVMQDTECLAERMFSLALQIEDFIQQKVSVGQAGGEGKRTNHDSISDSDEVPNRINDENQERVDLSELFQLTKDYYDAERYWVHGKHYQRYENFRRNIDNYHEEQCAEKIIFVDAQDIEGIYLSQGDLEKPESFWALHKDNGTRESLEAIAGKIPDVVSLYQNGMSLDDISMKYPGLEDCINVYFENIVKVTAYEDSYIFCSDGRHRTLAAKSIGGIIPVRVVGRIKERQ